MKKRIVIFIIIIIISFVLGVLFTKHVIPRYFDLENKVVENVLENDIKEGELSTNIKDENIEKDFKTSFKTVLDSYEKGKDTMYALADIDKDLIPELIVRTGESEVEYMFDLYKYKASDEKAELIGNIGAGHSVLYEMNNEKYLLSVYAHMGYETVAKVFIEDGKIKYEQISQRENLTNEEYTKGDKIVELYDLNDTSVIDKYK